MCCLFLFLIAAPWSLTQQMIWNDKTFPGFFSLRTQMIKGYLYLLLGLYKFKENHSQIFFFLFQRYAVVILSGTIIQGRHSLE